MFQNVIGKNVSCSYRTLFALAGLPVIEFMKDSAQEGTGFCSNGRQPPQKDKAGRVDLSCPGGQTDRL